MVFPRLPICVCLGLFSIDGFAQSTAIPVVENLWRLTRQEDTDGDRRITVHDKPTPFSLKDAGGASVKELKSVYEMSVLLQELKRAEEAEHPITDLTSLHLEENPVDRTHRQIKDYYWDALTRRIDAAHLGEADLGDTKVRSKNTTIYVPSDDPVAFGYFKECEAQAAKLHRQPPLKVEKLPPLAELTADTVRQMEENHGILSLQLERGPDGKPTGGTPFVVPGGRFNELYCWDSYFIVLGLLADGRTDLARGMAENLRYEIEHYGMIPNANRSYYLTRSQPPFFTSILRAVHAAGGLDREWLKLGLQAAVREYQTVWMGKDRLVQVGEDRLSRYYDTGSGPCPEVEPGHYDDKISQWVPPGMNPALFLKETLYGKRLAEPSLERFFKNDRAQRESGHDTTHRFDDRTADFLTVDLNALLYKTESDIADILDEEFGGKLEELGGETGNARYWREQAKLRKAAMNRLMWDEASGYYFDYDYVNQKRSHYISATGLYPLWAGMLDPQNDVVQARRIGDFAKAKLEEPAGLAASAKENVEGATRKDGRQWDYPYGWAPHQMLAWEGLARYGMREEAERLAYRWLYNITKNVRDYNGTVPEKYNVATGSHDVFVEYWNVGTNFQYIAREGFGWMNASYQVGLQFLSPERLQDLREMKPPGDP